MGTTDANGRDEVVVAGYTPQSTAFSTFTTFSAASTAAKFLGTITGQYLITEIQAWSDTAGTLTILEDTTTAKTVLKPYVESSACTSYFDSFRPVTPLLFTTATALHITHDITNLSIYVAGWTR